MNYIPEQKKKCERVPKSDIKTRGCLLSLFFYLSIYLSFSLWCRQAHKSWPQVLHARRGVYAGARSTLLLPKIYFLFLIYRVSSIPYALVKRDKEGGRWRIKYNELLTTPTDARTIAIIEFVRRRQRKEKASGREAISSSDVQHMCIREAYDERARLVSPTRVAGTITGHENDCGVAFK